MNKTRWLSALLIASWTLNVALIVAYFSRDIYPIGARVMDPQQISRERIPFPGMPPHLRETFHRKASPLHDEFERLMFELSSELSADTLDTVRFAQLSDSLQNVRSELQARLMDHLRQVHDELPPEGRHRLARRMRNMMDGPIHGSRHDRDHFRRDRGLFHPQSDSNSKLPNSIQQKRR